ncbi:DUF732 domain-containing protein [Mycobacterium sp.]|jgi:hypothetical protein|uniref:DUF732 domain-containing protein n=1 Tax=Mycobacterium sp. TaxID=1785 RepID=UPI0026155589|nr:DUF732 domain-containing protein [Mycobacterium sp.]
MKKTVLIPAVLTAGIAFTPLAQANTQDQMFIAYLDSHNVSQHISDMNTAVAAGHMACQELAAGKDEISTELDVAGAVSGNVSRADASWIIAAAKRAYCP